MFDYTGQIVQATAGTPEPPDFVKGWKKPEGL